MEVDDTWAIYAEANGGKLKTLLHTGWKTDDVMRRQRAKNGNIISAGKAMK